MAIEITAPSTSNTSFTISETNGNTIVSLTDSSSLTNSYTYEASGSGLRAITNVAAITGTLTSGVSTQVDLYSFDQKTIDSNQSIVFTGVKNFTVYNTSTTEGYDFAIQATGTNACTNLFNGGSGNLLVKPYSSFSYNDPYVGFTVSSSQRYIYLDDLGSGVSYKVFVFGLD
jgi:hypothetical protein